MSAPYSVPPEVVDRWKAIIPRRFATPDAFRHWMETPHRALDDMTPAHVCKVGGAQRVVELLEAEEQRE